MVVALVLPSEKPIFEYLNGSVSYDDIKLSLLFLKEFE
jgi:hypothetical protein